MLYEVASKANAIAGDGTTTATILSQSMIHKGLEKIDKGANPIFLKEGMLLAVKEVCDLLIKKSKKIDSLEKIESIASVSSSSSEIGKLIKEAISKVGKDGVININDSKSFESTLSITNGLEYDKGYVSPYMLKGDSKEIILEDCYILVTNHNIERVNDIIGILEFILKENKPLLIIANNYNNEVIETVIINKINGVINANLTKAPSFGIIQDEYLADIAIYTNSSFINKGLNQSLKDVEISDLGRAKKVIIGKDKTVIIDGDRNEDMFNELINKLRKLISEENEEKYINRLARLTGSVAVINVGGVTEIEQQEKKLRVEDAVNATKAALSEGIIIGGGCELCNVFSELKGKILSENIDKQIGINIVLDSLVTPLWQIAENAGYNGDLIVKQKIASDDNIGFNALNGKWCNMIENGIIDPVKVTKSAIINAVSVASLFLTTEAVITFKEEKEQLQNFDL